MTDETGWERETVNLGMMQYSVYAILGANSWSWHGEIERDDFTLCSQVMVELRTRKREMKEDTGTHHEKPGLEELGVWVNSPSPIGQVWVPIRWAITPLQGLPNPIRQVVPLISHIRSYPAYHSHLYPPSLLLAHNSTIIAEHKVKSSHSICPCHDHELTRCAACTEYSVHRIQHNPNTAFTQDCLSSLHSHNYELTPHCSFIFRHAALQNQPPPASTPW